MLKKFCQFFASFRVLSTFLIFASFPTTQPQFLANISILIPILFWQKPLFPSNFIVIHFLFKLNLPRIASKIITISLV